MTDLVLKKDENLIDSNPRDKALLIIMKLQKDPGAIKTKYYFSIYRDTFGRLAGSFFQLNLELVQGNFDSETIRGLEKLIIQKAKKWSLATKILMYGIPLVGWLFIPFVKRPEEGRVIASLSYRFLYSKKKLKKIGVDPMSLLIKAWGIRDKGQ